MKRAFSLIELAIVLLLIAILLVVGYRLSTSVLRQSNLTSELVALKGAIQQARGNAIANSVPVRVSFVNDTILAEADFDRDGSFGDRIEELVVGEDVGVGVVFNYRGVNHTTVASGDVGAISHWSGHADDIDDFPNGTFIVSPTGLIRSAAGNPIQGAYYLITDDQFAGALYVSTLGDVKMGIKEATGVWEWTD